MATLDVYDTEGEPYGGGEKNQRVSDLSFAGVRIAVDVTKNEMVAFFRAKEDVSRVNQYYAVYQANSNSGIFASFMEELEQWANDEGLVLSTTHDDTRIIAMLPDPQLRLPGSDFEYGNLKMLLNGGRRLDFGVGGAEDAFGLLRQAILDGAATSVAISDMGRKSALDDYDLVIEPGNYDGLEPLGETADLMDSATNQREEQLVTEQVDQVRNAVSELRSQTSMRDAEIRSRLQREVPALADYSSDDGDDGIEPQVLAAFVVGALVIGGVLGHFLVPMVAGLV